MKNFTEWFYPGLFEPCVIVPLVIFPNVVQHWGYGYELWLHNIQAAQAREPLSHILQLNMYLFIVFDDHL